MKLTFLGTGTSQGVPMIGCDCEVCKSNDPKDKRKRCSVWIQDGDVSLLIDATPDLHRQALMYGVERIDACIFTHSHADHIMGFDDLRRFCDINGGTLPIYASPECMSRLKHVFDYAFASTNTTKGYIHPIPNDITGPLKFGELELIPLPVPHGSVTTLGFLFIKHGKRLGVYMTDCAMVPDEVGAQIEGVPILIIDALRDHPHRAHMTTAQAIEACQRLKVGKGYLTHLTHQKFHTVRQGEMPENIFVAYDGLQLEL